MTLLSLPLEPVVARSAEVGEIVIDETFKSIFNPMVLLITEFVTEFESIFIINIVIGLRLFQINQI
jgi:hypothetical protein